MSASHAVSSATPRSPIKQEDVIASVADALQYISYYHSPDFIAAMADAYEREEGPAAKDAIKQILVNSRMCAEGHRPICQDTGIVTVFVKVGMNVRWEATMGLDDMINEGVRRAYNHPDNKLRASIVNDPAFDRKNTRDNTPAVIHMEVVPGDTLEISRCSQGRRIREQGQAHDAESFGLHRRLDPLRRAQDGRGLVPARHARHRHRRHGREGHGAREGIADGSDRHPRDPRETR
jgi:hypothetical protein